MLVSASVTPIDDKALAAWMAEADADGSSSLSFAEYVRMSKRMDTRLSADGAATTV